MRNRPEITFLCLVAALLGSATGTLAQVPFSLDTMFRTQIADQNVNAVHLLEDGKLFLSGRVRFPGDLYDRYTARLFPNGQADLSSPFQEGGGKIVPWVDGKFYVGSPTVRRRMPDGLMDPSFIAPHTGPYFQAGGGGGSDFHVFPDGRVLLSGASHILTDTARGFVGNYDLIWFSSEGYLDTTRIHRNGNGAVYRFAELADGKFICNGTGSTFEGLPVDRIFRVHADGVPDTTFNTAVYIGAAYAYLPLPDGRVYVGGNYETTQAPGDTLRLARFMPDGALDPTFSIPQFIAGEGLTTPHGAYVYGIRPWTHGRLIVNGHFKYVNGEPRRGICMIDTTGQLLDTFDDCGVGPFTYQGLTAASVQATIVSPDSSYMYICGYYIGYDDGTTNDLDQRFVSRLHLGDISTGSALPQVETPMVLRVWPNPAESWASVEYELPPGARSTQLLLKDAMGRQVLQRNASGQQDQLILDLDGFAQGVYLLDLQSDGARVGSTRLVVQ